MTNEPDSKVHQGEAPASNSLGMMPARQRGHLLDLPREPRSYLSTPGKSLQKVTRWLNARWRLRACTQVGRWTRLVGRPFVSNRGQLVIGDRVQLFSHYARSVFAVFPGGRLEIGDRTFLNYGLDIAATRLVRIGACLLYTSDAADE